MFKVKVNNKKDPLTKHLTKSTVGTFVLKITYTGLSFLISLVLARVLGASGFGVYAYAVSIVSLLTIPATLGLPQLLIRNIAAYRTKGEWNVMRGLLRWASVSVIAMSLVLVAPALAIIETVAKKFPPNATVAFRFALLLLPIGGLLQVKQSVLQGLDFIIEGQIPETVVRPILFILLLSAGSFVLRGQISPTSAIGIHVLTMSITLLVAILFLKRRLPHPVYLALPHYQVREWMRSALPLMLMGGFATANQYIGILLLGALKGASAVGIFKLTLQIATLIPLMLLAVNISMGPTISSLYTEMRMDLLQKVVTRNARLAFLFSLPVALAFIIFGRLFLAWVQPEFQRGAVALAILSIGQLFNVAMGSVGLLLIMTGHELDALKGHALAASANLLLSILLIPLLGLNGAALATCFTVIIWNLFLKVRVASILGIATGPLGRKLEMSSHSKG